MRLRSLALSACLIFSACSGGGGSSSPAPTPISSADQQAINAILSDFANATSQNKIVDTITQRTVSGENAYVFTFTDGTELSAPTRLVNSILENAATWRATVTFTTNQSDALFLRGTDLGLSPSDITLDPFGVAPLSARADFSTPAPGMIRVVIPSRGTGGIPMGHSFAAQGTSFSLPILGLYQNHTNQVEFYFSDVDGNELVSDTVAIETDPLSVAFNLNILQNNLPADDDSVFMIANNKLAFDQTGELRWVLDDPAVSFIFRKLPNGDLTASNTDASASYHFGAFTETSMLGEVKERYDVPNLIHHEMVLDPNTETYFVATNSFPVTSTASWTDGLPEEDEVIEIDPATKQVIRTWDFNTILDPTRVGINNPAQRPEDWAHINALYYDPDDTSFVVSVRSQSTVAKIDYETGNPIWLLGAHQDWPASLQPFLLTPVDAGGAPLDINIPDFWPSGQHAPLKLPNGDILVYDNGNDRGLYTGEADNRYSRAVTYRIDETAMTVQLVDVFPDHQNWYTPATGDVDYLPETGGQLISFLWGSADTPRLVELNAAGDVVFEATQNPGANYYRAEKFRLYDGIE